jgi:hypothetical protein
MQHRKRQRKSERERERKGEKEREKDLVARKINSKWEGEGER